jgi:hypothetical protein
MHEIQRGIDKDSTQIHIELIDRDHMRLDGAIDSESVALILVREPDAEYPLLSRGFN